jgi:hypothetical protein
MAFSMTELVGYAASVLVVVSLAMTSVVRLRVISLIGSLTFVGYGVLIGSIPIILTNVAVAILNVVHLRREFGPTRPLGAVPIEVDAPFLRDFVDRHRDEIRRSQPGFDTVPVDGYALMLTRDALPAGVLIGHPQGETLRLVCDFVLPEYRDSRLGQWLFADGAAVLRKAGFSRVSSPAGTPGHASYLRSVGFVADGESYTRRLG